MRILDPSGSGEREIVALNPLPPLREARIGYLDNTKWNLPLLFGGIERRLSERYGAVRVQTERKKGPSWAAPPDLLAKFAVDLDLYIVGIGD